MSSLETTLRNIYTEKKNKIIPENIKKDITVFGVTGTYEGSGGSGDVKLFATVEEMQQDATAQDGDLAVVYKEGLQPITEESEFDSCIFPNTVVLDEAFTGFAYCNFSAVDGSSFSYDIEVSSTYASLYGYGDRIIDVYYESQDGITYIREDGGDELIEFGATVKYQTWDGPFDEVLGNFMKISTSHFDGVYKYGLGIVDKDNLWFARTEDISFDYVNNTISNVVCNNPYFESISVGSVVNVFNYLKTHVGIDSNLIGIARKDDGKLIVLAAYSLDSNSYRDFGLQYMGYNTSKTYLGLISDWNSANTQIHYWEINEETFEPTQLEPVVLSAQLSVINNYAGFSLKLQTVVHTYSFNHASFVGSLCIVCGNSTSNTKKYIDDVAGLDFIYKKYDKYQIISAQLDAIADYVYNKTFYGKQGVEVGSLGTPDNSLIDVNAKVFRDISKTYDSMPVMSINDLNKSTFNLNKIYVTPIKFDGTPLLDTGNVTNFRNMFLDNTNLVSVTNLNTINANNMEHMFRGCNNLAYVCNLSASNVKSFKGMFYGCANLVNMPNFNTSNATYITWMFYRCTSLENLPYYDFSKVDSSTQVFAGCTNLKNISVYNFSNILTSDGWGMFQDCPNLTNAGLNNALASLATIVHFQDNLSTHKTLKWAGLSEIQANVCTNLSNWAPLASNGWTTGY